MSDAMGFEDVFEVQSGMRDGLVCGRRIGGCLSGWEEANGPLASRVEHRAKEGRGRVGRRRRSRERNKKMEGPVSAQLRCSAPSAGQTAALSHSSWPSSRRPYVLVTPLLPLVECRRELPAPNAPMGVVRTTYEHIEPERRGEEGRGNGEQYGPI